MTVAVAHNDTPEGRAALLHAVTEARLHQVGLVVLHIVEGVHNEVPEGQQESVEHRVRATLEGADLGSVEVTVRTAGSAGDVAGALVDLLAETGADLLVLGTRKRSAIGKLLLGSIAQRVLLDSPVPVLVVKANEA